ncbi:MAG: extracellular solute-binding protein [Anaerolineales bacterium]|nr:extracellular solute-binding protein [Anaerolineales bacterium]
MKRLATLVLAVAVLFSFVAACAAPTPEVVEKEVIVEKEVPVTVEVEKEVVVEKKVVETVEVEVTREVIVDPTACNLEPPESPIRIDMIGWTFPVTEFYAEELEKCSKVANLEVNAQLLDSGSAGEQQDLALAAVGKSPFEIFHTTENSIAEYASQGWLFPLNDLIEEYREEYDLDDIIGTYWEMATYEGKIYGIPLIGNTKHLFYRPDLLEKYGLDVPETYDDVIAACEVLKQEDSIDLPFTINLHAGWAWNGEFTDFYGSFRGNNLLLNEDNTPAFNGPEGLAAVEKLLEVVDACMGEEGLTYSIDDSEIGMETGGLAMVQTWASRAANMDDPDKSEFVGGIGFAPAPRACPDCPHAGGTWADFYSIPARWEVDPDLIFRVIMEAADLQSQMEAAELSIVTRGTVVERGAGGRYLEAALETIANGPGGMGKNPARVIATTAIGNWLPLTATGELTPQEALDAAAEEYIREATAQGYLD